jgi:coenzyme F420 hydrogenase subunit beta
MIYRNSSGWENVASVADWRLCLGCGACAYICPEQRISLVNDLEQGIRPIVESGNCASCSDCIEVCPAVENDHRPLLKQGGLIPELKEEFGPVIEVWEGHAADPEIRHRGSSGGLLTALSLFCLEHEGMHGILHVGMDPKDPTRNRTKLSQTRAELMASTGSRYAPASVCDSLELVEKAPRPCVVIGQPSEITALRKAQQLRPNLAMKTGLTMSFFCAGSPTRKGTLELLQTLGVDANQLSELRYRGKGWPGKFSATLRGQEQAACEMTYRESWGFVQAFRPFSTHLCPDGSGEDADLSCGDPWYRPIAEDEQGSSIVLVRTERGRQLLERARQCGYVQLTRAEPWKVLRSQEGLIKKRGAIWGRILTLRMFGVPAPRLRGFSLFRNWWRLPIGAKLRSVVGTARRIVGRKYFKPTKSYKQS